MKRRALLLASGSLGVLAAARAAAQIGVTIPQSVLIRADKVVE